jgi:hypothetical protein
MRAAYSVREKFSGTSGIGRSLEREGRKRSWVQQ